MRVTTIGTGTASPHPQRVQSAVLLETGTSRMLVDCGSGVAYRMSQLGLDWHTLTHLAITHFHSVTAPTCRRSFSAGATA